MVEPTALELNVTSYEFDYFSGSQISIYIGDILIDDIQSIQFQVSQTKRPVYGYASQYYHALADGQVLVEGAFTIPFKEADYILLTLQHYREIQSPISAKEKEHLVLRESIERLIQRTGVTSKNPKTYNDVLSRNLADAEKYEFYNQLSALTDEDFEDIAETFEDTLWQSKEGVASEYTTSNLTSASGGNEVRRGDQYPPFDIWILYGDISNKAANHTIKKIIKASIIGQGQAITSDGTPILEEYRFVAKNLA